MTSSTPGARGVQLFARPTVYVVLAAVLATALALAAAAVAHQTTTSRGVSVTLHVNPDDEPIAGEATTVRIVTIKPPGKGSKFKFGTCGCRLRVAAPGGAVAFNGAAAKITNLTFPDPGAYEITYSGSYRTRTNKKKTFSATFAVRAVAPS